MPSASLETQGIKAQAADGFYNGCTQAAEEQEGERPHKSGSNITMAEL